MATTSLTTPAPPLLGIIFGPEQMEILNYAEQGLSLFFTGGAGQLQNILNEVKCVTRVQELENLSSYVK
jgi:hypothetical protein